jgi:hypothetical protein
MRKCYREEKSCKINLELNTFINYSREKIKWLDEKQLEMKVELKSFFASQLLLKVYLREFVKGKVCCGIFIKIFMQSGAPLIVSERNLV